MTKRIKICPICGSTDLREFNWGQWMSMGFGNKLECVECMHCDTFFPEVELDKMAGFKKRILENKGQQDANN